MRALLLVLSLLPATATAQVPSTIGYQGRLLGPTGTPQTGIVDMQFSIFDAATGGNAIWCEQQTAVALADGYYSLQLGEGTACTPPSSTTLAGAFAGANRFLEVSAHGAPLSPRQRIGSVPAAYVAQSGGTFKARSISIEGEDTITGQGTIAGFAGSVDISGGGSAFKSQVGPGDMIMAGDIIILVAAVTDDTHLTAASKLAANLPNSGYTVKKPVARIYRGDGSVGLLTNAQGHVGIGTTTPQAALDVNGDVNIKGKATVSGTVNAVERLGCLSRWGTWAADSNTCTESIVASSTAITYAKYPEGCTGGATKTCSCWSIIAAAPQLVAAGINVNGKPMWCEASETSDKPWLNANNPSHSVRAEWWGGTDGTMHCASDSTPCLYIDAKATGGGRSVIELGCCNTASAWPAWCCRQLEVE